MISELRVSNTYISSNVSGFTTLSPGDAGSRTLFQEEFEYLDTVYRDCSVPPGLIAQRWSSVELWDPELELIEFILKKQHYAAIVNRGNENRIRQGRRTEEGSGSGNWAIRATLLARCLLVARCISKSILPHLKTSIHACCFRDIVSPLANIIRQ